MTNTSSAISGYRYDQAGFNHSHGYLLPTVFRLLDGLNLPADQRRLFELGCGNGSVAHALTQRVLARCRARWWRGLAQRARNNWSPEVTGFWTQPTWTMSSALNFQEAAVRGRSCLLIKAIMGGGISIGGIIPALCNICLRQSPSLFVRAVCAGNFMLLSLKLPNTINPPFSFQLSLSQDH
jgi:2-polyprenyl-6-hydroxyphenyl methylase/3-demethylubiquinone-9 3-methyltransferase